MIKFNGELWLKLKNSSREAGEPDEYAVVRNPKKAGGVIAYARYGNLWTENNVPARPLIRLLCDALMKHHALEEKL